MKELLPCPFCGHKASAYQTIEEKSKFNPTFTLDGFGSLGYNTTTKKKLNISSDVINAKLLLVFMRPKSKQLNLGIKE